MNDIILQQLEILIKSGITVNLISATNFKVSGLKTWFHVLTETQETSDNCGLSLIKYETDSLANHLIIRFHNEWINEINRENKYECPPWSWCKLFSKYQLPYKLNLTID